MSERERESMAVQSVFILVGDRGNVSALTSSSYSEQGFDLVDMTTARGGRQDSFTMAEAREETESGQKWPSDRITFFCIISFSSFWISVSALASSSPSETPLPRVLGLRFRYTW